MKISLLTVGRTDVCWVKEGMDLYVSRLRHYVRFEIFEIPELKNVSSLTRNQIRDREGELILSRLRPSDEVILLDEHGRRFRSVEFASFLQSRLFSGGKNMVFVIGGAYGFSDSVHAVAKCEISLSEMTFSHQMVRVIFAEQLYRAFTIMGGEPYHHE